MSKLLSELLGANEPFFSIGLGRLELGSGNSAIDVRLTADILSKSSQKTKELGLDPKDSTAEEIYYGLIGLARLHDSFLARRLGASDPTDVQDILSRMKGFVLGLDTPKSVWVLKQSTARRLLKATPPKAVMKQLGYRSLDSMIKREPTAELMTAIRFIESPAWQQKFIRKYRALSPSDFEIRDLDVIQLNIKKWGHSAEAFVRATHHNVTYLKELGVVAILPLPIMHMQGLSIVMLPLLLHYMHELRVYSAFFKLQQVKPDFGNIVAETLLSDPGQHASMAGHDLHWRIIHQHFAREGHSLHPEVFEPHVQPEDLFWRKSEEVLYRIEPALHFWHDMDYVGLLTHEEPVSFNLMDIAVSNINRLPYGAQATHHFRQSLWNELYMRYLEHPGLEAQVLKQLETREGEQPFADPIFEGAFA